MVVFPAADPSATPLADIVATFVAEELQVTSDVILRWLPSL
jgi:hypothetical protein